MMNRRFNINSVSSCLPICRSKLFEEVIHERKHGEVDAVWLTAGHLFVSLQGGARLVTFDAKCADYIQSSDTTGYLDLICTSPVVTVLSQSANKVFVVHQDGQVQRYSYRNDRSWRLVCEFSICTVAMATVTSACLNVSHTTLYFCQQEPGATGNQSVFSVYRRQLKEEEDGGKSMTTGPATAVITNCPDCCIYPMGHGIILTTKMGDGHQVSLCVILCTLTSQVDVVAGGERMTITDISLFSAIEFRQIVLKCLKLFLKPSPAVVRSCYVPQSQTLLQLYEDGLLVSISMPRENVPPVKTVKIPKFTKEELVAMVMVTGCAGLVYRTEIRLYSLSNGDFICSLGIPEDPGWILGTCDPILGGHQSGVFTEHDVYLIQRSLPRHPADRFLLECQNFQTDAVKLSYINKLHRYTSTTSGTMNLETLREAWVKGLTIPPTTKLVETVEPFLSEFWKLENMLQEGLTQPKVSPEVCAHDVSEEVLRLLDPRSPMSRSVRQAQLVYLSHWFPVEVVDTLLSRLHYSDDDAAELSTANQQLWQYVLAQEHADLPGNSDVAVPLFELMCFLLYKHKPDKMLKFLQRAQKVWDHKVGMSAYRRRPTLMVYERALKCLPEPEHSVDKLKAIHVHTHILLTSEVEGCFIKAVRLLLRYDCWEDSIDLLAEYRNRCKQYTLLYQMVISSLTKNQKLHVYADRIFHLMPQFNSCDNIQKGDNPDLQTEVFAVSEDSVRIDCVRPHLLKCLGQGSEEKCSSGS